MTDANDHLLELLREGELAAAADAFAAAPDREAAVGLVGEFLAQARLDFDELPLGLRLADLAIAENPDESTAHEWKLETLKKRGAFDEAFAFAAQHRGRTSILVALFEMYCVHDRFDDAAALHPDLAEADDEVGNSLYDRGCKFQGAQKYAQAVAFYRGAIAVGSPEHQPFINGGIALFSMGRPEEAAELAREGIERWPREPNIWANVVDAVATVGDVEQVRKTIAEALPIVGNSSRCDECEDDCSVLECTVGCNALLDDIMAAMISVGDCQEALDAYDAHGAEGVVPVARLQCTRARALAGARRADEAHALLDSGLDDGASFDFQRARAAAAWAAGDRDRAVGALAAALQAEPDRSAWLRRDAAFQCIADSFDEARSTPIRPPAVPMEAVWDEGDAEWVVGTTDGAGVKQGLWKYYRSDGTLCNECPMVDDLPHGEFKRFHENGEVSQQGHFERGQLHGTHVWFACAETTTEALHGEEIAAVVRRSEMDRAHGRVIAIRHYDAANALVAPDGTAYPDRPESVPEAAFYLPEEQLWRYGELDDDARKHGVWRSWAIDGSLLLMSHFDGGEEVGVTERLRHESGDTPNGFPPASTKVVRVEADKSERVEHLRYFDALGRETLLDGTPLESLAELHAPLAKWFEDLKSVDWTQLEDASGNAHFVPQVLINLLSRDGGDDEAISDAVYQDLYWHLCHRGTVYDATAAALPFLFRLLAYDETPYRTAMLGFVMRTSCVPRDVLEEARRECEGWEDFLATYEQFSLGVDVLRRALADGEDEEHRNVVTRGLACQYDHAEAATKALLAAVDGDTSAKVRLSALIAVGQLGTKLGIERLEATCADSGLPGVCAALGLSIAFGTDAPDPVVERLRQALEQCESLKADYSELVWAEGPLDEELREALERVRESESDDSD